MTIADTLSSHRLSWEEVGDDYPLSLRVADLPPVVRCYVAGQIVVIWHLSDPSGPTTVCHWSAPEYGSYWSVAGHIPAAALLADLALNIDMLSRPVVLPEVRS